MSQTPGSSTSTEFVEVEIEKTHPYPGAGTVEDPFVVEFHKNDQDNPMNWAQPRKWFITVVVTCAVFAVTFTSAAYSVSAEQIEQEVHVGTVLFSTGVSVFVLGFAVGPAVWGPLVSSGVPVILDTN